MPRTWSGVIARMGAPTGDGRILDPAGAASRNLPLPLSWQERSGDGHDDSVTVARIESVRFADGMVWATGTMLASAPDKVIEDLEAGIIGPSVDLDDIEYVMDEEERIVLTKWRIAGATLVTVPAFADVGITLDPEPAPEVMEVPEAVSDVYADWDSYSSSLAAFTSAVAQRPAPPVLPPVEWFTAPGFDRLTPLTVTEEGRVFGHIAPWGECHVGLPGCVTAPASVSSYAYFHVGEQMTQAGPVPVGTLVAGPAHADPQLAFRAAQAHYDDPSAAVARVVAGEDEFGIWVAGWLLPTAREEAVEVFRSSPVSGDWRRIGGALELIAVCSVNAPGFPVPRARVAFSAGAQRAFIGSFGVTPHQHDIGNPDEDGGVLDDWDNCRDPECPGPGPVATYDHKAARARWAWATMALEG